MRYYVNNCLHKDAKFNATENTAVKGRVVDRLRYDTVRSEADETASLT